MPKYPEKTGILSRKGVRLARKIQVLLRESSLMLSTRQATNPLKSTHLEILNLIFKTLKILNFGRCLPNVYQNNKT